MKDFCLETFKGGAVVGVCPHFDWRAAEMWMRFETSTRSGERTQQMVTACRRCCRAHRTVDKCFDGGHPVVLVIKLQVYIYIY